MSKPRYTAPAIGLHWLIALLILISFSVGLYMSDLPFSPAKLKIYSWHKWAGVTIFLLVVVRSLWRFTHTPPPCPGPCRAGRNYPRKARMSCFMC